MKTMLNYEEISGKSFFGEDFAHLKERIALIMSAALTADENTTLTVEELMNGDDALLVISPANAYNKTLKYSSDKPKIVKVDKNGKMTAVGTGTAKITIKANDGSKKSLTLKVTVEKAEN